MSTFSTPRPASDPQPPFPKAPAGPVVPPDDPNRPRIDEEPSIDPPPLDPPMHAPFENPTNEPPAPLASQHRLSCMRTAVREHASG